MQCYTIHDLTSQKVTNILREGLSKITDPNFIKNYHPDYDSTPGNLFYILNNGRYKKGKGAYYVVEDDDQLVCCAGWNEYELDPSIALLLTRMYVSPEYRSQYIIGNELLPMIIEDTMNYNSRYMTVNEHNRVLYEWFVRLESNKALGLSSRWPDIYKNFKPIGKKDIYYTEQYVVEYKKG